MTEFVNIIQSFSTIEIVVSLIFIVPMLFVISNSFVNALVGPRISKHEEIEEYPKVSIMVPARNEENNIERCINSLIRQDYPNFEIILLDDNSTDNTLDIIKKYAQQNDKIKYINGKPLPEGWLGKNWACKQLSERATGDYFIFTDADNWHKEDAINNTIAKMQKLKITLLSAFPQQITHSFSEKLIIPMIDMIVYSGLILWMTYIFKSPIFAAANGQWIAFKADDYKQIGGHEAVKDHIVEDVAFSRLVKTKGKKMLTVAGTNAIFGRMYNDFAGIWQGLSKNVYGLTDFKAVPFFILLTVVYLSTVVPYILAFTGYLFPIFHILIGLNIIWRLIMAISFKHNLFVSLVFHPLAILMLILIGLNSYRKSVFGELIWKDRTIKIETKK